MALPWDVHMGFLWTHRASMGISFRGSCPWCFHSISMRRPWKHVSFIGASMGAPRCFHVCGDFHNASMGIPWGFHGASMVPPCGAAMVPPWCFHGTFVVLPSVALPWCLQLPWSFDGASMGISWCFHDVFSSV